jgi:hypothetical protein
MLKCYDKTYGRYFIDSERKWRKIDRQKKEQKEENREQRSLKIIYL